MSSCNEDLCDYDLVKKCSKCENFSLKSNFHKRSKSSDGLNTHCKYCLIHKQKQYGNEKRDKKKENTIKIIEIE